MIAVFAHNKHEYHANKFYPIKNYMRITRIEQLFGRRFTGVIVLPCFNPHISSKREAEALEILVQRQPELFR